MFYHKGLVNSVVALTDQNQDVRASNTYTSYGLTARETGEAHSAGAVYSYTCREIDRESGLCYMRARYFSARSAAFLQEDPLFAVHLFNYAGNNPICRLDSFGLGFWEWLYTGDWDASPGEYNAALGAAGDYVLDKSGVRGLYLQLSISTDLEADVSSEVGGRVQWTIEDGREGYVFVQATLNVSDMPEEMKVGYRHKGFGWKEECRWYGPGLGSLRIKSNGARIGVLNRRVSLGVGVKGIAGGIIVDPGRVGGNFADSFRIIRQWLKRQ
jgi:RHS repeat-associated protein